MKLSDSHEWLMWRAAHGSFDKPRAKPAPILNMYPTAAVPVAAPKEKCAWTPKPPRSKADYIAERRERSRQNSAVDVMQKRLVRALFKDIDVASVEADLGYSMGKLRVHLERQFADGMTWSNHASMLPFRSPCRKWAIDHVVPKSSFASVTEAFAITNLRPLWWTANMRKAARRTHLI